MENIKKTEEEWRKELSSEQFHICREGGTEVPFSGEYVDKKDDGMYYCVACGNELFMSDTKFESGTGWPSFFDVINSKKIEFLKDYSLGMQRVEVRCSKCGSHLGHVFDDGPKDKTGKRYCINSAALGFKKK